MWHEPQTTSSPPAFISSSHTNPLQHTEKKLWISTGNTQKRRTGRNERRTYSCIISALHMIHSCWSRLVLWRVQTRTKSLQVVWRREIKKSIWNQLLSHNLTLFHLPAVFLKDGEAIKHTLDYPFSPSQIFSAFFEVAEVWENPVALSIWSSTHCPQQALNSIYGPGFAEGWIQKGT